MKIGHYNTSVALQEKKNSTWLWIDITLMMAFIASFDASFDQVEEHTYLNRQISVYLELKNVVINKFLIKTVEITACKVLELLTQTKNFSAQALNMKSCNAKSFV